MTSSSRTPSRDAEPATTRVELLHESERTRVTREHRQGGSVIRKQPLEPDAQKRLHHERAILEILRGAAGLAQLSSAVPEPGSILLEDADGICLATRAMPLERTTLLPLALGLARAVAEMHRRHVLHRDIHPENILLTGASGAPCLIDFAQATTFAEIHPEFTHHTEIVGNLAYIAPEQTGRTGRPVDQRADLYALGATLYELATGAPPFGASDPLRLSHDHLARVPAPPDRVNPAVPPVLSQIILHLLEKEPDHRYQTADGLVHDLARLHDERENPAAPFQVGERDFPLRLLAPPRLVGREAETAELSAALDAAMSGSGHGVLISGPQGVGKSALVDRLRPIVTASDGWFVAGRFDPSRRDLEFDAVWQAFRGLGRLLLAEPDEVAALRERLLDALGPNAGLMAALHPSYATLLGLPAAPQATDPLTLEARLHRVGMDVLRVVASRKRPVVFVVDDLQWASRTPLGFVDATLSGETIEGLVLVCAYRDDEVDDAHPLSAMLSRWQRQPDPPLHLRLANLPPSRLTDMVGDMLRLDTAAAAPLAAAIAPHTEGNPYRTVEILNALRHDGLLTPADGGWNWDAAALRRRLGEADLDELLATRVAALSPHTLSVLYVMACLGSTVDVDVLQAAADAPASMVESRLATALDDGLLVMEPSGRGTAVRFRHDRVRRVVLDRLDPRRRRRLRLRIARRLGRRPEMFAVAAEQYLPVIDAVRDPDERARVAALLTRAARQAELSGNPVVVERCLAAAIRLTDQSDHDTLVPLLTARHTALYSLGRLDDADEVYREIDRLCTEPEQRVKATLTQVSSLTNRNLPRQAIDLGLAELSRLGMRVPPPQRLDAEIERALPELYAWIDETSEANDVLRPESTDPALPATAAIINLILPTSYGSDPALMNWLALEAVRLWRDNGPSRNLVGSMGYGALSAITRRRDYRTAYRLLRRILAVAGARGYEPEAAQVQLLYTAVVGPWFEPLEENIARVDRAREVLTTHGEVRSASFTYAVSVPYSFECASSLDSYVPEVEAALAVARRTGADRATRIISAYRSLAGVLRGERLEPADDGIDGPDPRIASPSAVATTHITRALAAALLGDLPELSRHTAAAMALLPVLPNTTQTLLAHVLRALALACQARGGDRGDRRSILAELDASIDWVAARAADAPENVLHLLHFIEAERAWAVGDFRTAARVFDAAQQEAASRRRPWHRALIIERAARLYIAHGLERVGHLLLSEARQEYVAWGALAKVDRLDWAYPTLQPQPGSESFRPTGRSSTMAGAIDLLGILTASQALSSEMSIDRLRSRVVEVLSAMTGATGVQMLVWNDDERRWLLATSRGTGVVPLADAGRRRLVPLHAIRYAERTREPLVVVDATTDDRFSRDPYFTGMDCCSLMVVPVVNRGIAQAMLLLENRLIRGAFSTERLDSVMLIAAQLAVSLDNTIVYASLERKVIERTEELALTNEMLRSANDRLEQLSMTDPLTGLANRRQLQEALEAGWRRALDLSSPISFAMIDIDHFKLYNDHYGHAAGDRCLQRVAAKVRQNAREVDLAARYGGEEFALVIPGMDAADAVETAERLRADVLALAEPHALASERVITVSVGVAAAIPAQPNGAERLVESADVELYRAKRSGRNQVRATFTAP